MPLDISCPMMVRLAALLEDEQLLRGNPKRDDLFFAISALLAEALQDGADERTLKAIRAALAIADLSFLPPAGLEIGRG
ncbi:MULTISPECIES: hypothetical protein [Methylobacterium]|uniref:hypothetical protein n=1 Tax=Methylobacterium TaxID=407 RepID=UPI0010513655|nr:MULTISPECIES: hypothetical protein [Methylobacterium]MDR7039883.1 hypothetical protein [Methylobacterium sp. BE186]